MPPTDPLQQDLAPRGSAWFYATLPLRPAPRRRLLLLQSWWRAVRTIPGSVSDPIVAAAKLGWWQAQLQAVDEAAAEHPLLRELQPALREAPGASQLLRQALDTVQPAAPASRDDWDALHAELLRGSGSVARVAMRLAGCLEQTGQHYAAELAAALELVMLLRDVGRDAREDVVRLPRSLLRAHGLDEHDLTALRDTPALRAALREAAGHARQRLRAADALRPQGMGRAGRVPGALGRMGHALLDEIEGADYALMQQRISLPPLRLLWAAWRAGWTR